VESEYTSHNFIVLAIRVPKIIKFGGDLTKLWQRQVGKIFLIHPIEVANRDRANNSLGCQRIPADVIYNTINRDLILHALYCAIGVFN